ncbi:hypothetical protein [Actinoplanes hulinensis]|uniref:hypothetical protein n=1 Tax=Actinoplanes hulinensis TaxID=1144547 RepID=UPI001C66C023|nr:hypothetical protein [Actinoplanes hulinensis]
MAGEHPHHRRRISLGLPEPTTPARPVRDGLVAVCLLPVRPGRVKAVTDAGELRAIDGVISASVRVRRGSTIGARLHSASAAGTGRSLAKRQNDQ